MLDLAENIGIVCGGILVFITTLYAMRKFIRALFPIKIAPSVTMSFTEKISSDQRAYDTVLSDKDG